MNNFESLIGESFESGFVIVEDTLFEVSNSIIVNDWELSGNTIEEKVEDAIVKAELSEEIVIYYDDEGYYNKDVIISEGRFVSPADIPMTENEESYCEYFN